MRVEVTQRHISAARESVSECPVRLALVELLPGHAVTGPFAGRVWIDGTPAALPLDVWRWCCSFEAGDPVQPFGFDFDPAPMPAPVPVRHLNASGWCCNNTYCPSPVGCPTVSGGRGGEVCRACATDAADIALFDNADKVTVFADPESDKPLVEWMPNTDQFSPVKGFANIIDGRGKGILYRVREVECGSGAGRSFDLVKLRDDAGDRDARSYTCTTTAGGLPWACECRGYLRHETACKHMRGIGRLVHEGVL